MIFTFKGKRYRWHPEVFARNMLTAILAGAIAAGMGALMGYWIISLL